MMNLNKDSAKPIDYDPDIAPEAVLARLLFQSRQRDECLETPIFSDGSDRPSLAFQNYPSTNRTSVYNPPALPEKKKRCAGCRITRGIALALVFLVFVLLILCWFFFSSDLIDEEFDSIYGNNSNITDDRLIFGKHAENTTTFSIITTVFIVISIIILVFASSLIQYFRNPGLYQDEGYEKPSVKSAFESIFSSHRTMRNDLYYLDLNMKATALEEQRKSICTNENEINPAPSTQKSQKDSKKSVSHISKKSTTISKT